MYVKKKMKSQAGFTLAETLLAVLILLLVSTIVATGMPVARTAYEKVVLTSNAETLLATAVSALRNELGTAWKVESITDEVESITGGVSYFNASTGTRSKLYVEGGAIKLLDYAAATDLDALLGTNQNKAATTARDLVFQSDIDRLGKLTLKADSIVLTIPSDKGNRPYVTISGLSVEGASGSELTKWAGSLVIDVFSADSSTGT